MYFCRILQTDARNPDRPSSIASIFGNAPVVKEDGVVSKRTKRVTSPERWELKLLGASGVLNVTYVVLSFRE